MSNAAVHLIRYVVFIHPVQNGSPVWTSMNRGNLNSVVHFCCRTIGPAALRNPSMKRGNHDQKTGAS